jgi:hypothetical protein
MIVDHFIDMEESGSLWIRAWRCVSCGDVVDNKIRHRRMLLQLKSTKTVEVDARVRMTA